MSRWWISSRISQGSHRVAIDMASDPYNFTGIRSQGMASSPDNTSGNEQGMSGPPPSGPQSQAPDMPASNVSKQKPQDLPPEAAAALSQMPSYRMEIRRLKRENLIKVATIPPEEFLISRDATSVEDAAYVGQRRSEMRISDLVAMGYDFDELVAIADSDPGSDGEGRAKFQRNPEYDQDNALTADPSMRKVKYTEGLIRLDADGDGVAELLKVCTAGNDHKILSLQPATEVNVALFSPSPDPHTAIGRSIADETMDLQKIKSNMMRFTLDGLAQSLVPRTAYDQNLVNAEDMASIEVGANVRVKGSPGNAIMPIATAFPAGDALTALQYM